MKPHEDRVVVEKQELDEKLAKLKSFCFGENPVVFRSLDPSVRDLLERQYTVMEQYSTILQERIARFEPEIEQELS